MQSTYSSGLVWLRRDLRLADNAALAAALQSCAQVHCVFILDRAILDPLPRADRRVEFIRESLCAIDAQLRTLGAQAHTGLIVRHGWAQEDIPALAQALGVEAVFCARDYEPQAVARDAKVQSALARMRKTWVSVKDHVVFEQREILTQTGKPYGVFTPYLRAWLARLEGHPLPTHDCGALANKLASRPEAYRQGVPTLVDIGFVPTNLAALGIAAGEAGAQALLADFVPRMGAYEETRNFPAVKGPSYLSVHLRFGTVSIRQLVNLALGPQLAGDPGARVWLAELVWRDFYFQVLSNFPHVAGNSFKPDYDAIAWEQGALAQERFAAWCEARTGYPLVDAAMAQLNQSGYMHNRLRMVAGSFLVKHLGIDWRWGERYFAQQLNDLTSQPTTAAGNGSVPAVAMPSPISASLTPSAKAKNSMQRANLYAATYRRWPGWTPNISTRPGWHRPWYCRLRACNWERTTRIRWWTMQPLGRPHWRAMRC